MSRAMSGPSANPIPSAHGPVPPSLHPTDMSAARPSVVVIGSGFGGAVTAYRLASSQQFRVTLLERGHRYQPGDFPRLKLPEHWTGPSQWATSAELPDVTRFAWRLDQGLWDVRDLRHLQVVQGAGYGGGSLIYASVHLRAPAQVFKAWPKYHCANENCRVCATKLAFDAELLTPYYEKVEAALGVGFTKRKWPKTRAFEVAAESLNRRTQTTPLAIHFEDTPQPKLGKHQSDCTGCGDCVTGCNEGAKSTLDRTYLHAAEAAGLSVRTLSEVTSVERLPTQTSASRSSSVGRYRVHFVDHFLGAAVDSIDADFVFVCAGAVNSTELLSRSVALGHLPKCEPETTAQPTSTDGLQRLGSSFWANGDAFGVVFKSDTHWDSSSGPTITRSLGHTDTDTGDWFLIQEGGIPANLLPSLSMLQSPALCGVNAYSKGSTRAEKAAADSAVRWLLARATEFFPASDVSAWSAFLPKDLRAFLPVQRDYQTFIRSLVESRLQRFQQRLLSGQSGIRKAPWRWLMRGYFARNSLVQQVQQALQDDLPLGHLIAAPHILGVLTRLTDLLLLGQRPDPRMAVFLAMGADAQWHLTYDHRGKSRLTAHPRERERVHRLYRLQERVMRDLAQRTGGELRTNPAWTLGRRPVTVHSQGGCTMGEQGTGVVFPNGEVQGHPGLFVSDASIFPSSVGVNPAHTIAALAELNVEHFLQTFDSASWTANATEPCADEPVPEHAAVTDPATSEGVAQVASAPSPIKHAPTVSAHPKASEQTARYPVIDEITVETQPTTLNFAERIVGAAGEREAQPQPASSSSGGLTVDDLVRQHSDGTIVVAEHERQYWTGVQDGASVVLRLRATIDDVDRFVGSHAPTASIAGTATVMAQPREGASIAAEYDVRGGFTLKWGCNAAGTQPGPTRMCYDLLLRHVATAPTREPSNHTSSTSSMPKELRLLGTKILVDDSGFDALADLTTLYVDLFSLDLRFHRTGILRVSIQDFLTHQLPSFQVDADDERRLGLSNSQRAWTLLRFFNVFLGRVSHIYRGLP